MRKILDGIAVASFAGFLLIAGGGAYGYFWLKGNQDQLVDQIVKKVAGDLPIPKMGGAMPLGGGSSKSKLPF